MLKKDQKKLWDILGAYQAPQAPQGYSGQFWARMGLLPERRGLSAWRLGWRWAWACCSIVVVVLVVDRVNTEQALAKLNEDQIQMIAFADNNGNFDAIEHFEAMQDLDTLEALDEGPVS